jgi:hypothetical protein
MIVNEDCAALRQRNHDSTLCWLIDFQMFSVLLRLSRSDCTRYVSTAMSVILSNLIYDGCTSSTSGGAVSLNAVNMFASITDCTFLSCVTSIGGCGVYLSGGGLVVLRCQFSDCQATQGSGPAVDAYWQSSSSLREWNISETVTTRGFCGGANTWYLASLSWTTGADITFERSNLTNSTSTLCGLAVTFSRGGIL